VKAFEPYYGRTVAPPTDPNLLYDARRRLDEFDVLRPEEIEDTVKLLMSESDPKKTHGKVYALLDPAVERWQALSEEDRLAFKDALDKFVRTYSFLSQIVSFGDVALERDYTYCRALALRVRDSSSAERLDLGAEVEITHLRTQQTFEGSLSLESDEGEVKSVYGEGAGRQGGPDVEHLSEIVAEMNERFGLDLDDRDKLLFDQFEEEWLADRDVVAQAQANTIENFRLVFDERFLQTIIGRMDENETIFKRILDDEEFRQALLDLYAVRVYRRARRPMAD
jgi:type I restriction enzyme R subunit